MATIQINRFKTLVRGNIAITGNTIGGIKSSSYLELANESTVLYAYLMWTVALQNLNKDEIIEFEDSNGNINAVTQDPGVSIGPYMIDKKCQDASKYQMFQRGANVTDIVKMCGKGTYTVRANDETQIGMWALCVAYQLDCLPLNYLAIEQTYIDKGCGQINIHGFQTPPSAHIHAKMYLVKVASSGGSFINQIDISDKLNHNQQDLDVDIESDAMIGLTAYTIGASAANIQIREFVNKKGANPGEEIIYTCIIDNSKGSLEASDIVLYNSIPDGATFVEGSFMVDEVFLTGVCIENGIRISNIDKGLKSIVKFKVLLGDEMPNVNPVQNKSKVVYKYTSNGKIFMDKAISNTAKTYVGYVDFSDGKIVKNVDKQYVGLGDIITCDITIKNEGSVDAINCTIIDTIPYGASFIPSSLIGGFGNPNTGINIKTIKAGQTYSVSFQIKIDIDSNLKSIQSKALLKYEYNLSSDEKNKSGEDLSNETHIKVRYVDIKPIDEEFKKSQDKDVVNYDICDFIKRANKRIVKVSDILTYNISMKNCGNVDLEDVIITVTNSL